MTKNADAFYAHTLDVESKVINYGEDLSLLHPASPNSSSFTIHDATFIPMDTSHRGPFLFSERSRRLKNTVMQKKIILLFILMISGAAASDTDREIMLYQNPNTSDPFSDRPVFQYALTLKEFIDASEERMHKNPFQLIEEIKTDLQERNISLQDVVVFDFQRKLHQIPKDSSRELSPFAAMYILEFITIRVKTKANNEVHYVFTEKFGLVSIRETKGHFD